MNQKDDLDCFTILSHIEISFKGRWSQLFLFSTRCDTAALMGIPLDSYLFPFNRTPDVYVVHMYK